MTELAAHQRANRTDGDPWFIPKWYVPAIYDHIRDVWRLTEAVEYQGPRYSFEIPAGFEFDGASVPRPFWGWLPPHGRYLRAALVHDWMYRKGFTTRAIADAVFREIMAYDGVWWGRHWLMWMGVRLGGRRAWKRHRRT